MDLVQTTIMGKLGEGLSVTVIGMGVVFVGLIFLIIISYIMSKFVQLFQKEQPVKSAQETAAQPVPQPAGQIVGTELRAVVSTAVAAFMGVDPSALQILSVKPCGKAARAIQVKANSELDAVIYSAVAAAMGASADGIRVHSVKKLS